MLLTIIILYIIVLVYILRSQKKQRQCNKKLPRFKSIALFLFVRYLRVTKQQSKLFINSVFTLNGNISQLCAAKHYRNEIRVLTHTRHVVTNLDSQHNLWLFSTRKQYDHLSREQKGVTKERTRRIAVQRIIGRTRTRESAADRPLKRTL